MTAAARPRPWRFLIPVGLGLSLVCASGCASGSPGTAAELRVRDGIQRYATRHVERLAAHEVSETPRFRQAPWPAGAAGPGEYLRLGVYAQSDEPAAQSQPTERDAGGSPATLPRAYWKEDLLHQTGSEAKWFVKRDFWRGFKVSFWDLDNALFLTAAMGASVAIREGGVDDAVNRRVRGHRQFRDLDETVQLLGHPAAHLAAGGALWLASALTEDRKQHEVAKSLLQALAVNGVSTLVLKGAANTRGPDGDRYGWPSGHTSSAFTTAAVLNEHYGPWVGIPSLALAGLVGYQRIDSGTHDLSDVVFGAALGYVIGSSIASDNEKRLPELFGMTVVPYTDPYSGAAGFALTKRFR